MLKDNLTACGRCGGDACYESKVSEGITTYWCFGCGFTTNTLMKKGEAFLEEQLPTLPELYRDLLHEDEQGWIWMPSNTNIPVKGMVFLDGTSYSNWWWSAALSVEVKEEEREKYPIPGKKGKYYEHKIDMTTIKHFPADEYMEALDYIGIFNEQ